MEAEEQVEAEEPDVEGEAVPAGYAPGAPLQSLKKYFCSWVRTCVILRVPTCEPCTASELH